MSQSPERKAQERADRIAAFRAELVELEGERALILTPEQRVRLDAHFEGVLAELKQSFGVDLDESARRFSWGMRIATLLGGAAFFAAMILFLHRIWGLLPAGAHVFLLTAIPLALLGAADLSFRRGAALYYTALLAMAAGLSFVVGLSALGSTFNLAPSPHALLAWGIFAVLAAHAFGLRLLLGAGLVLLCVYTAAVGVSLGGAYWTGYTDRAEFLIPSALVCYFIPALQIHRRSTDPSGANPFDFVHRACGAAVGLTALLALSFRGDLCCGGLPTRTMSALYQLLGIVASGGVVLHGLRLGRTGLVNLGAAGFVGFLYVRLHVWWWDWMPKYLFFLFLGLIAIALLFVFKRMRARMLARAAS
jgi:uncharacterized membrane protein